MTHRHHATIIRLPAILIAAVSASALAVADEPSVPADSIRAKESGQVGEDNGPLREGWSRTVTISRARTEGAEPISRLKLWVEMGWLIARREAVDGQFEWQTVLARASDPAPPEVAVGVSGNLDLSYRAYFIRESAALEMFRLYRERKTEKSPEWPILKIEGRERASSVSLHGPDQRTMGWIQDHWAWLESGISRARPDFWLRLGPATSRPIRASTSDRRSSGRVSEVNGPLQWYMGDSQVWEDGNLIVAIRTSHDTADRGLGGLYLSDWFKRQDVPFDAQPVTAREWLNDAGKPLLLHQQFQGKVTLIGFWSASCPPSVTQLVALDKVHRKYAGRGLFAFGVQVAESDAVIASARKALGENTVTLPVMVDRPQPDNVRRRPVRSLSGETAERYLVDTLPAFFLIDKHGLIVRAYGMAPPAEAMIEPLLLAGEAAPPLEATEWRGADRPVSVAGLKGKVVLLVFGSSRPLVADHRITLESHLRRFADRGLVVVGIHGAAPNEVVGPGLAAQSALFPVGVDRGETAKRYAVNAPPTYVLIDRAGNVAWGSHFEEFSNPAPPTEAQIEELLK